MNAKILELALESLDMYMYIFKEINLIPFRLFITLESNLFYHVVPINYRQYK